MEVAEQDLSYEEGNEEGIIAKDEEGETMHQGPDMPIEIQGIRIVTAEILDKTLTTYNAEAVA